MHIRTMRIFCTDGAHIYGVFVVFAVGVQYDANDHFLFLAFWLWNENFVWWNAVNSNWFLVTLLNELLWYMYCTNIKIQSLKKRQQWKIKLEAVNGSKEFDCIFFSQKNHSGDNHLYLYRSKLIMSIHLRSILSALWYDGQVALTSS